MRSFRPSFKPTYRLYECEHCSQVYQVPWTPDSTVLWSRTCTCGEPIAVNRQTGITLNLSPVSREEGDDDVAR